MNKEQILNRMRALCSKGEKCRSDIFKKIESYNIDSPQELVDILCRENFIDDRRYAAAFARDKSSLQGWGEMKIRLALRRKGIEDTTIEEALDGIDCEQSQKKLVSILKAKYKLLEREKDQDVRNAKLFRFAMGRGYKYEQIKKAYDIIRSN
ncbi:MAG: regulatory protein RecX [Bacteroidales bacterium]|nr:regulatory protein RecX [Bacteroidales bacterium]MDD4671090.1 regulatory protein RecX [Bacteroidales bacterium]